MISSFLADWNAVDSRERKSTRSPPAFADHAAEFHAGSGDDRRRALKLARANVANRPTRRAVEQAGAIAMTTMRLRPQRGDGVNPGISIEG
jgi:hypothetical protein